MREWVVGEEDAADGDIADGDAGGNVVIFLFACSRVRVYVYEAE